MSHPPVPYAVVVPTVGRPCLADCLRALAVSEGPEPRRVVLVDDRPDEPPPGRAAGGLPVEALGALADRAVVLRSGGLGPAAARNTGLREVAEPWVVFLDDDVRVGPSWRADLVRDLAAAPPGTGGVQGVLRVPLPARRRPTDWERNTAGLEHALWATADMAYRTEALRAVGGFDERFRRAFREDADLALRVIAAGWPIRRGTRRTEHPVRPADRWVSLRAQRGNADDALMVRLHGPDWWARAAAPRGRIRRHAAITAAGALALVLAAAGRHRAAAVAAGGWLLGTAEFARARIAPGPRTRDEVLTMAVTSAAVPVLATWHRLAGELRHRSAGAWDGGAA
ncbi:MULTISPECIES: glycosyltransferase family 2 protein [Streptomyces]|uniref:Glycosyltransferase n=1 Tax=Streptomyces sudanensis TaxID=436397 RepID=A0ABY4THJ2_9ACTN|nr:MULTISPECIES: glycosyltransferase [Streptomyces]MCP9960044.1 glycosyltransferase [Streptomyces sudanensis]MCP9999559.1 glycosyltransferase [Streptomyces sudanensis]URN18369.1 glycosyltransferase [Streptomyces sudanensis]